MSCLNLTALDNCEVPGRPGLSIRSTASDHTSRVQRRQQGVAVHCKEFSLPTSLENPIRTFREHEEE